MLASDFADQRIRDLENRIEQYQLLLDGLPYQIWLRDTDGNHLIVNRKFCETFGYSHSQLVGKNIRQILSPAIVQQIQQEDEMILTTQQPLVAENLMGAEDQDQRYLEITKFPVQDHQRQIIGIGGAVADVTARKQAELVLQNNNTLLEQQVAERTAQLQDTIAQLCQQKNQLTQTLEELHSAQARLVQTEKMSSLGQLVAGIAHEINNPVNFIHGNLAYIKDYSHQLLQLLQAYQAATPPTPEIKAALIATDWEFISEDLPHLLQSVQDGASRIHEIVNCLRTFSRIDESEIKTVDIHAGLDSTILLLQHRCRHIQLVCEYDPLPMVECYPALLNQVFMNLLINAMDAVEGQPHPRIHIRTRLVEQNWVEVVIADNGPGISQELQSQLFNPFFTTKPVGKGTGLGLAISYQIITDRHGGDIWCQCGPETEFIFRIPRQIKRISHKTVPQ